MLRKLLLRFTLFDLVIMALMASLGIAIKPLVVPLAHIITGPLYIPGGAVAGGFYMMWMVVGTGIVGKRGTATLIAIVQALMVVSLGIFGTHGIMSIFTYILPGVAIDLILILIRHRACCAGCCFIAGAVANISGSFLVNIIFFRLPFVPLVLSLSTAALSGGLGGLIANSVIKRGARLNPTLYKMEVR